MATIVTRTSKGSALTFAEGDANFTNLNNDKLEDITNESIADLSDVNISGTTVGSTVSDVDAVRSPNTITLDGATAAGVIYNTRIRFTGSDVTSAGLAINTDYYIAASIGSNAFELSSTSNGSPIAITDPGTITDFNWTAPDLSSGSITNGQTLVWDSANSRFNAGTISGGIANVVEDTTPQLGGNLDVNNQSIVSTSNGNIAITPDGTGQIILDGLNWPTADGTNNQVIKTDGAGNLSFVTISAGISNVVEDTTPQLGGNLDVNNQSIVSTSNGNIAITPDGTGQTQIKNLEYNENVYSLGTTSGTITPDAVNGNVQTITLNGNLTFSAFSNPISGQTITLIINTNGTNRTLTSTMKFAGGSKTLSTTSTIDILTVSYVGTTYYASLVKDYK